jgi:hypothetical protein
LIIKIFRKVGIAGTCSKTLIKSRVNITHHSKTSTAPQRSETIQVYSWTSPAYLDTESSRWHITGTFVYSSVIERGAGDLRGVIHPFEFGEHFIHIF